MEAEKREAAQKVDDDDDNDVDDIDNIGNFFQQTAFLWKLILRQFFNRRVKVSQATFGCLLIMLFSNKTNINI